MSTAAWICEQGPLLDGKNMSTQMPTALAGLVLLCALAAKPNFFPAAESHANESLAPAVAEKIIKLQTGPLFRPIFFPDHADHEVTTSVELEGQIPAQGEGRGMITFGLSRYQFNDFGDPELTEIREGVVREVVIREARQDSGHELRDFWRARRWYELVFENDDYKKRFYLVLSGGAARHHQLLVRPSQEMLENEENGLAGQRRKRGLIHVLNFHGEPSPRLVLGDRKFGGTGSWTTAMPATDQPDSYLYNADVSIYRHTQTDFTYVNIVIWTRPHPIAKFPFVDGYGGPMVDGTRYGGRLQQVSLDDPKKAGRVLFELNPVQRGPAGNKRYRFVFSPTTAGPHRMLLYQGDELKHCLPLDDEREETLRAKQLRLQNTPKPQQQAIAELRKRLAGHYHYNVEEDAVEYLHVYDTDDMACVNRVLAKLPGLKALVLTSCQLDREPLENLTGLKQLERLNLESCAVSPELLANVARAANIRGLTLKSCQNVDEACLAQIGQAKSLEYLCLRSMLVTDAVLMQLGKCQSLKRLDLIETGERAATFKTELQARIPGLEIND